LVFEETKEFFFFNIFEGKKILKEAREKLSNQLINKIQNLLKWRTL